MSQLSSVAEALVKLGSLTLCSRNMPIVRVPEQIVHVNEQIQIQTDDDAGRVPEEDPCTRILVSGIDSKVSKEFLEDYFENKRRSSGGPIKKITLMSQESKAVIEFEDSSGEC